MRTVRDGSREGIQGEMEDREGGGRKAGRENRLSGRTVRTVREASRESVPGKREDREGGREDRVGGLKINGVRSNQRSM